MMMVSISLGPIFLLITLQKVDTERTTMNTKVLGNDELWKVRNHRAKEIKKGAYVQILCPSKIRFHMGPRLKIMLHFSLYWVLQKMNEDRPH